MISSAPRSSPSSSLQPSGFGCDQLSPLPSKKDSALRQTKAAIEHLYANELESAITLAGVAEGQLPETARQHLYRVLVQRFSHDNLNLVRNWLKHPSGPESPTISEFEAVVMISRAIQKFVAAYEASCEEFESFSAWAVEKGHLPRLLTVDRRAATQLYRI